jgi:tetratricopeptide (TPR) repeat protein
MLAVLLYPDAVAAADDPMSKALRTYREGSYEQARAILVDIVSRDKSNASALHLLGLVEASVGRPEAAQGHLEASVSLAPSEASFALNLARFLIRQQDSKRAELVLEQSTSVMSNAQTLELLGLLRLEREQSQSALECFEQSLQLAPDRVSARYYAGLAYESLGQFDRAIASHQAVLALTPNDFYAHMQLGKLFLERGELERALMHLQASKQTDLTSAAVHVYLSRVHLASDELELALKAAEEAIRLEPAGATPHYQLGQVLSRLGRMDEARRELATFEKHRKSTPADLAEVLRARMAKQ